MASILWDDLNTSADGGNDIRYQLMLTMTDVDTSLS